MSYSRGIPEKFLRSLFCYASLLFAGHLHAQDGGQLYATYCSACHGVDGKGVPAANSPPLGESPWIAGPPDRAVKVVLHGLEGPIEVLGKPYNLTMPPQGAVLPDDVVAAILTYVRSSFGNQESAVSADQVKAIRATTATREKAWTAPEILKLHPLPKEPSALKNLISRTYFGNWKDLPDFSKLTSANVEEEHDGIISLDQATKRGEHFGMVWEADFEAEKDGDYEFYFDADDGGRVFINGKRIAEIKGLGPMNGSRSKTRQVKLTKGLHPIRIEYYEVTLNDGIQLGWKGPGMKAFKWVSKQTASNTKKWPEILLTPKERPVIYRNFIAGSTARAIGVGFPGGVNLAWSADHLGPALLWKGDFIDAGRHWTDRGQGNQDPAGQSVAKLTDKRVLPDQAIFKGYTLDAKGNPTFEIRLGEQILRDNWQPTEESGLQRVISLTPGPGLEILLASHDMKGIEWLAEKAGTVVRDQQSFAALKGGESVRVIYTFKK
jgi:mono/diheme cytochrome c family protein